MKWVVIILFLLFELYLLTGAKLYFTQLGSSKYMQIGIYVGITIAGWVGLLSLLFGNSLTMARWAVNLFLGLLIIVLISKLFFGATLLVDDVRRLLSFLFGKITGNTSYSASRSEFLVKLGLLAGSFPLVLLTYGAARNPYRYRILRTTIPLIGIRSSTNRIRIVQISDIHAGSLTRIRPVSRAVDMVNSAEPDLVLFTGDLVNNLATEVDPFIEIFGKIRSRYGVYSVLGNHDYGDYVNWANPAAKAQNLEDLREKQRQMGWKLLLNESETIEVDGTKVSIIGVENFSALRRFHKYGKLGEAAKGTNGDIRILLSHDPSHWDYEVNKLYPDIDVTFSGHTHGFQFGIEIPGFIKWSPSQYVYKQWAGLYQKGKQYLYVNRGFGFLAYPGRVGVLPEITVIDLVKNSGDEI